MKLPRNKESGQALIMVLILLTVASLLITPLLYQSFTNLKYNQLLVCKTFNNYAADAGIQYGTCKLYNDPATYLQTPLQDVITVNGRTVNVTVEYQGGGLFSVVSTASGGGCGQTTIRSVVAISHGAFTYALAAKTSLTISNAEIDSHPLSGMGHICSNGNIDILGGQTSVCGNAFAVGTITGKEKIVGDITEGAEPERFPSVYIELYETIAKEGGTHPGDLEVKSGFAPLGPLYITGDFVVKHGATVLLTGPLYIEGNIDIKGFVDGNEHVLAEGKIDMTGGYYGTEEIPVLISIYNDVDLVGDTLYAVVYAPNGTVRVQNLYLLYGAAGGDVVTVSNANIEYAASLSGRTDLPGSELYPLTYSYD